MNEQEFKNIQKVAERLIFKLKNLNILPICDQQVSVKLSHILWMLEECQNPNWHYGKANRWLAWCQCVLHYEGIIKGETERNETRDIFQGM